MVQGCYSARLSWQCLETEENFATVGATHTHARTVGNSRPITDSCVADVVGSVDHPPGDLVSSEVSDGTEAAPQDDDNSLAPWNHQGHSSPRGYMHDD